MKLIQNLETIIAAHLGEGSEEPGVGDIWTGMYSKARYKGHEVCSVLSGESRGVPALVGATLPRQHQRTG